MARPANPRPDGLPVGAGLLALAGAALLVAVKRQGGPGSALKRLTKALGVPPCPDCQRRAAAMDRWFASPHFPRGAPRKKF
jgi:hypothetical protein